MSLYKWEAGWRTVLPNEGNPSDLGEQRPNLHRTQEPIERGRSVKQGTERAEVRAHSIDLIRPIKASSRYWQERLEGVIPLTSDSSWGRGGI